MIICASLEIWNHNHAGISHCHESVKSIKLIFPKPNSSEVSVTVEPRLSGLWLSGFFDYLDFFSGPNLDMNIYLLRPRSVAISCLKLQHWKALTCFVTNEEHSNEFWLAQSCNIHIFDYPDHRLSGLFRVVPTTLDNRGSTVLDMHILFTLYA